MKRIFVLLVVMASVTFMQAQKLKGDLSPLSGQKELNVVFVYDGVTYDGDSEAKFQNTTLPPSSQQAMESLLFTLQNPFTVSLPVSSAWFTISSIIVATEVVK